MPTMSVTAAKACAILGPWLSARLAPGKKVDLRRVLNGIDDVCFDKDEKARLTQRLQRATDGKLAHDHSVGELAEMVDTIDDAGFDRATPLQHKLALDASMAMGRRMRRARDEDRGWYHPGDFPTEPGRRETQYSAEDEDYDEPESWGRGSEWRRGSMQGPVTDKRRRRAYDEDDEIEGYSSRRSEYHDDDEVSQGSKQGNWGSRGRR
jgi:hypothetical protein